MVKINIDGKELEAREGSTVLEAARENNIDIPTICYHPELTPSGDCRLCLVEIVKGSRSRLVVSCLYPVEPGLVVKTSTERVKQDRKMVMQLLLSICPGSELLQKMGKKLGVEKVEFPIEKNPCILCGLCVKVCKEVVGVGAIGFAQRGTKREVSTPFGEPSGTCIGCGSCVFVCPTKFISMEDKNGYRIIPNWGVKLKMVNCSKCGQPFAPDRQLEHIRKKLKLPKDSLTVCPSCK